MKRAILSIVLSVYILGCGATPTSDSESSKSNKEFNTPANFDGIVLYNYLVPRSDKDTKTLKYKNEKLLEQETLRYKKGEVLISQRSLQNLGGKVEYQIKNDGKMIGVTIFDKDKQKDFDLQNFIYIGDRVTLQDSSCELKAHYDSIKLYDQDYKDVIEIDCPNHIGYYQKGSGVVVEDIIDPLEQNDLDVPLDFSDRKLGLVDSINRSRFATLNLKSAQESSVDKLWISPYNLNGDGIKIGLVDGGSVRSTHVELRGRVHNLSNADINLHATHVAGTLISSGVHLYKSRGFAKNAQLFSLNYSDSYFADSVKKLFDEEGVLISNHSYGFEGSKGIGEYDGESKKLDLLIRSNPYLLVVMAAGNDGKKWEKDSSYTKWNLIKGGANAKNVITVASVNDRSSYINDFSSRGPIDGGRLKPDIAMDGNNVLSTSDYDDTAYKRMYGTSMATPAATGTIALLSQRYKQLTNSNPRVDTMKAILFNTAQDIENKGPDFKSGFGRIDALSAVKVIDTLSSNEPLIKLDTIHKNEIQKYYIANKDYQKFKVTVAWIDDTVDNCGSCANDRIINDIDIYLKDEESGKIIYPYTLDEYDPNAPAKQNRANRRDPQEQIEFNMTPGNYRLYIDGSRVLNDDQDFTMVSSIPLSEKETNIKIVPMREHIHDIYNSIE